MPVGLVVFVSFRTNEEGYPFETSTDDECFFSLEIADGFVVRCLARSYRHLRRFPLNVRAVSAKIKLPKKYLQHCHILRTDKKNLSLLLLPS